MPPKSKLFLNLYWHMHQPDYRNISTGEYVLPWTYLHAIKDYSDMAYHLEKNPKARVTFNFVPVLLEQLEDYRLQLEDYRSQSVTNALRDPLLALLVEPNLASISAEQCQLIVQSCFKAHHEKMLTPFAHYLRLLKLFEIAEPVMVDGHFTYLSAQYKADLLVWYHLAWCGESIRKHNATVIALMKKGLKFTFEDRQKLLEVITSTITELIPRYKRLLDAGQIELSSTPYYHPILPLLIDLNAAKDAMPYAPLPKYPRYEGGAARAREHVAAALVYHAEIFGQKPHGMWPAEGGVSHAALSLMAEHDIKWAATGQSVLSNSLNKSQLPTGDKADYLYRPYRVTNGKQDILCFFRDDILSDKIGFEYAKMHATDAVNDFIAHLELIASGASEGESKIVSVILDGENAWEYYPYNGYHFLNELYAALVNHPIIEMTTFNDIVQMHAQQRIPTAPILPQIAAGSWVYGTFSTWIGSTDKNLAWDLLCDAKKMYDQQIHQLNADEQRLCARQLAICEGSDWFWWFGDYNGSDSVKSFDQLYRLNLINLYQLLKQAVPHNLYEPISQGGDSENAGTINSGTMRRGQNTE